MSPFWAVVSRSLTRIVQVRTTFSVCTLAERIVAHLRRPNIIHRTTSQINLAWVHVRRYTRLAMEMLSQFTLHRVLLDLTNNGCERM